MHARSARLCGVVLGALAAGAACAQAPGYPAKTIRMVISLAALLDMPTVAELGVPGFGFDNWYAVFVPGGTPRDIVVKLQEAISRSLTEPDARKILLSQGLDAVGSTPEELAKMYAAEIAKMAKVVKQVGMQPN